MKRNTDLFPSFVQYVQSNRGKTRTSKSSSTTEHDIKYPNINFRQESSSTDNLVWKSCFEQECKYSMRLWTQMILNYSIKKKQSVREAPRLVTNRAHEVLKIQLDIKLRAARRTVKLTLHLKLQKWIIDEPFTFR